MNQAPLFDMPGKAAARPLSDRLDSDDDTAILRHLLTLDRKSLESEVLHAGLSLISACHGKPENLEHIMKQVKARRL